MLLLINEQKNCVQILQNYNNLHNCIEAQEKQRNASKAHKRKGHPWVFTRHSCQRMANYQDIFAKQTPNETRTSSIKESGWDILEIVSGNPTKPCFIPLVHDLDLEALQKNWCHRYCHAHGLNLIEIADVTDFRKLNQRFGS